jgi:NAD+ synthetase
MPVIAAEALIDNRVAAIRSFHEFVGAKRAQLDVSGGVDSAVMLGLLALALGPDQITAVHSVIHTNDEQTARAREVAVEIFGVSLIEIDLTRIYERLVQTMRDGLAAAGHPDPEQLMAVDPTILGSLRSTLRAPVGRGFNRMTGGGLRHGTGNECEDRWTRFYQKGGDGEVDTNPIAMLSKAEVYQLALKLGVPRSTIAAAPSPDLWGTGDGHNDEDEFAAYFGFDPLDAGQTFYGYIDSETGAYRSVGLIERVSRFVDRSGVALFVGEGEPQSLADIIEQGTCARDLAGVPREMVRQLLTAARRIERSTRHKFNPNCPTLGERAELVAAGILSNDLPSL